MLLSIGGLPRTLLTRVLGAQESQRHAHRLASAAAQVGLGGPACLGAPACNVHLDRAGRCLVQDGDGLDRRPAKTRHVLRGGVRTEDQCFCCVRPARLGHKHLRALRVGRKGTCGSLHTTGRAFCWALLTYKPAPALPNGGRERHPPPRTRQLGRVVQPGELLHHLSAPLLCCTLAQQVLQHRHVGLVQLAN